MSDGLTPAERHRDAFKRKWDDVRPEEEIKEIPPPLVAMRDATDEEVSEEARAAAELLRSRGIPVRLTFSQGGEVRHTSRQGKCGHCEALHSLYVDNRQLYNHARPAAKCAGSGIEPGMMRLKGGVAVTPCAVCEKPIKPTKKGLTPSHQRPSAPCPGSSTVPAEVIEPKEVEPVCVVALRAWPFGVAVFEDGNYSFAYVWDEEHQYARKVKNKTEWGKILDGTSEPGVQAQQRSTPVRKTSRARRTVRRSLGIA